MNPTLRRLLVENTDRTPIQLLRYGLVGGLAAVVDVGSFGAMVSVLGLDYRLAVFLAFALGTGANFILSNAFIFDRKSLPLAVALGRIYMSALGGLLVNELVMIVFVEVLHQERLMIGKLIATGCAFVVNFTLVKNYAFNSRISVLRRFFRRTRS